MVTMEFPVLHSEHDIDGESEAEPEPVKRRLRKSTLYPAAPKPSPSPAATFVAKKTVLKTALTKPKTNPYATRASSKKPVDIYEVPDDEQSDENESDDGKSYAGSDKEQSDNNESDNSRSHAGSDEEDEYDDGKSQAGLEDEDDDEDCLISGALQPVSPRGGGHRYPITPTKRKIPSPEPETLNPIKRGRGRPRKTPAPTTSKAKAPRIKTSTPKTPTIKNTKPPSKVRTRISPRLRPKKGDELWALSSPWDMSQKASTPIIVRTGPTPPDTDGETPAVANRKPIVREPSSLVVPRIQKKRKTMRKKVDAIDVDQELGDAMDVDHKQDREVNQAHYIMDHPPLQVELDQILVDQELGDAMDVDHEQVREVDQAHHFMDHPPLQVELDHILSVLDDYQDGLREILAQTYDPPTAPGRSSSGQSNTKGPSLDKNAKQPYTSLSALVGLQYHEFPEAVQKSIDDIIESTDSEGMRILISRLVGHPSAVMANDNGNISIHSTADRHDQRNKKPKTELKLQHHHAPAPTTPRPYTAAATRPQRQFSLLRLNQTSSFGPSLFEDNYYQDYLDNGGLDGQNNRDREAARNELEQVKATVDLTTKSKDIMHKQLRGAFNAIAQVLQTNKGLNEALRPFPTDGAKLDKAIELLHSQTNTWTQILGVPKRSSATKGAAVKSPVKIGAVLNGSTKKGETVKGQVQTEIAMRGPTMKEAATKP